MKISIDVSRREVRVGGTLRPRFTNKEQEILKELLRADRKVLTRADLLVRVWGYPRERAALLAKSSRSLDLHICKIRAKLGQAGTRIKTLRSEGYRLVR